MYDSQQSFLFKKSVNTLVNEVNFGGFETSLALAAFGFSTLAIAKFY